jgi:signal peptidase II
MKLKYLILISISAAIISLDQVTKLYILSHFGLGESIEVIKDYFNITYVRNPGAAFGFLADSHPEFRDVFFLVIPPLALLVILHALRGLPDSDRYQTIAFSLIFGGAIGNYIDRIRFRYVIDFLDFHIQNKYVWPAFNVADASIVCGVGLLLLPILLSFTKKSEPVKTALFLPLAFNLVFSGSVANAAISKPKIEELVKKGEGEAKICNANIESIKSMDKNFDDSVTFQNKKVALLVLKKLQTYPGIPSSTQALMDHLSATPDRRLDFKWLAPTMDKTLVCDPMAQNHILTKLIRSARKFKFSAKEKKLLAQTLIRQMKHDAEYPTHLGLLAPYLLVIDSLVDLGAIRLDSTAALKRESLKLSMDKGLDLLRSREGELRKKVNSREFQTQNFIHEVRANEPTRIKFLAFVEAL